MSSSSSSIPLADPAPRVEPAGPVQPVEIPSNDDTMNTIHNVQPAIPSWDTIVVQPAPVVEPAHVQLEPLSLQQGDDSCRNLSLADPPVLPCESLYTVESLHMTNAVHPFITPSMVTPAIPCTDKIHVQPAPVVEPAMTNNTTTISSQDVPSTTVVSSSSKDAAAELQFQGIVGVTRGTQRTLLQTLIPFLFDERDFISMGEISRFIVIQHGICFVYTDSLSYSLLSTSENKRKNNNNVKPLYTIALQSQGTWKWILEKEDLKNPHPKSMSISPTTLMSKKQNTTTSSSSTKDPWISVLLLEKRNNNLLYQFVFDTVSMADEFIHVVQGILNG